MSDTTEQATRVGATVIPADYRNSRSIAAAAFEYARDLLRGHGVDPETITVPEYQGKPEHEWRMYAEATYGARVFVSVYDGLTPFSVTASELREGDVVATPDGDWTTVAHTDTVAGWVEVTYADPTDPMPIPQALHAPNEHLRIVRP